MKKKITVFGAAMGFFIQVRSSLREMQNIDWFANELNEDECPPSR